MARAAILREMSGVFGAYKIDVNARHLELIADYMVCDTRLQRMPTSLDSFEDRHSTVVISLLIARGFLQILHPS